MQTTKINNAVLITQNYDIYLTSNNSKWYLYMKNTKQKEILFSFVEIMATLSVIIGNTAHYCEGTLQY